MWIGFKWLGTGSTGEFLWTRQWTFRAHKSRVISWLVERLLASQNGLWSMPGRPARKHMLLCYLVVRKLHDVL
jgi:hypothetical protein